MTNKTITIFLSLLLTVSLAGCEKKQENTNKQTSQIVTIKKKALTTSLPFNGNIEPIEINNVTSTQDGVASEINFKYGELVTKGQELLSIDSLALQKSYRDALTSYLKAKESYLHSIANFDGTKALWNAKIISKQDYLNQQEQFHNSELAFTSAKYQLRKAIEDLPISFEQIETLSLNNIEAVRTILSKQYGHLEFKSPASGVALFPVKSSNDSGTDKKLYVGSEVKKGQLLLSIGDMSGVSMHVNVSEIDINRVKPGLKTRVTSPAIPGLTLHGEVKSVGSQAESGYSGESNLAMFPVVIVVPKISSQAAALIRVGISAKAEVEIKHKPSIMIPIDAVYQKNGQSMVALVDSKTNKAVETPIETGQTTVDSVVVLKGLKPGDKIMVPPPTQKSQGS